MNEGSIVRGPAAQTWLSGALARGLVRWLAVVAVVGPAGLLLGQAIGPAVTLAPLLAYALSFGAVCALAMQASIACPARGRSDLRLLIPALVTLLGLLWQGASTPAHAALVLASLLAAGTVLGAAVGASIEDVGQLLFVVIVSSAADALSVLHPSGPSAAIVESEVALSLLALPFAFLGTADTPPLLGVGDVVFTALYVAAGRRHGLAHARTVLALSLAYVLTMIAVVVLQRALPALPLLGLSMLIAHPRARIPQPRDRTLGFPLLAVLAVAVAWLVLAR